eukprot:scaffold4079_cov250-Pinguiococcus_pyrenoidosus.AAC.4
MHPEEQRQRDRHEQLDPGEASRPGSFQVSCGTAPVEVWHQHVPERVPHTDDVEPSVGVGVHVLEVFRRKLS